MRYGTGRLEGQVPPRKEDRSSGPACCPHAGPSEPGLMLTTTQTETVESAQTMVRAARFLNVS